MFIYSILTISLLSTTAFANNERINSLQDQNKANKTRIYNLRENNIDIKAPDNYGVSHNKYQHFNIGKDYITHLNNDATRNQNMINQKTGPAKIIINEITHDEITYLNGQLNVKVLQPRSLLSILMVLSAMIANLLTQLKSIWLPDECFILKNY